MATKENTVEIKRCNWCGRRIARDSKPDICRDCAKELGKMLSR